MTPNYPKHPLFRITPLLHRGFQTVQFDPYERVLIAKIRAGAYSSDLWDSNGLYLDYADRLASPADRQTTAFKSRYEMTPQQHEDYRREVREQWKAGAPAREARRLEQQRITAEFERDRREKREAERKAELEWNEKKAAIQAERDAEWERAGREKAANNAQWQNQRDGILAARWECSGCLTPSQITFERGAYVLSCSTCGRRALADHPTMLKVMSARINFDRAAWAG
jgi:hypothetical protein